VICAVIIDNLSAQSQGLDRILDQPPILHVKCFAHMTNLAFVNTSPNRHLAQSWVNSDMPNASFASIELLILFIGSAQNFETRSCDLMEFGEIEGYRVGLPGQIFELYYFPPIVISAL
jgi:hypothetical protein